MGLLSPFLQNYYGQQQPFGQQFGGPTPQMPQSPFAALQQPVPMPTMGAPQPAPFALNQPTAMPTLNQSPLGAGARGPTMGPKGPMQMGGANKPGGFMGRLQSGFNDLPNNSLFQLGMSLLGNAQNGGNWGQVGQDMMAFSDRQRQRQIQDNEMRRQKVSDGRQEEMYGWTQEDRQREAARRQRFNEFLPTVQDPELRAILEASGAENYGQVLAGERGYARDAEQRELDRRAQVNAAAMTASRRERLTPVQTTTARRTIGDVLTLRESYDNFVEMLRTASPEALAGIGEEGARLEAAHTLLALQAKSPAALDLGALVGADFDMLDRAIGNPGDLAQLVRQGGRDGVLSRLQPFGQFLGSARNRVALTYEPFADDPMLADAYERLSPEGMPTMEDVRQQNAAPAQPPPRIGEVRNGYRYIGGNPNDRRSYVEVAQEQPGGYRGR